MTNFKQVGVMTTDSEREFIRILINEQVYCVAKNSVKAVVTNGVSFTRVTEMSGKSVGYLTLSKSKFAVTIKLNDVYHVCKKQDVQELVLGLISQIPVSIVEEEQSKQQTLPTT